MSDARAANRAAAPDLRLAPAAGGLWLAELAVCLSFGRGLGWTSAAIAASAAAAVAVAAVGRLHPLALTAAAGLVAGGLLAGIHALALSAPPLPELTAAGAYVTADLRLTSVPEQQSQTSAFASGTTVRWRARADLVAVSESGQRWDMRAPVRVAGSVQESSALARLLPGATIRTSAVLRPAQPATPFAAEVSMRGPPELISDAPVWQQGAAAVRDSLVTASAGLPEDAAGLLPGLVVGDDGGLPEDLREDMRLVGMSHLTAVSGANLAIVTGMILLAARALRVRRSAACALAAVGLLGFVVVVGPQPSVLRAAVMGLIALAAIAAGRTGQGFQVLAAAVVILLLLDPGLAISIGFALSVAATGGLLAYAARARGRPALKLRSQRARRLMRDALAVTLAAQLATAPLVAGIGGGLPLIGVPANLLAAPAVAPATIVGAAAAVVGLISPAAAQVLAAAAGVPTQWIAGVARAAADVPGGVLPWPSGIAGCALMLVAYAAAVALIRERRRLASYRPAALALATALAALVVFLIKPAPSGQWPPPGWHAVICDVGQGDASVFATAPGHAIVIDAGPDPKAADRCLRDLGIETIDLLILTHFHADHVEGIPGLLRGRSIGAVAVSPLSEPLSEYNRVQTWLEPSGVQIEAVRPGEEGGIGPVRYRYLWPQRILRSQGSDPNNASVTALIDIGDLRILMPGDLEPAAQEAMISATGPIAADVVKIPHHGSRNQSPRLIPWSGAGLAIASAGAGNTYGHPSPVTLDAWRAAGAAIGRTDRNSDIAIVALPGAVPALVPRRSD